MEKLHEEELVVGIPRRLASAGDIVVLVVPPHLPPPSTTTCTDNGGDDVEKPLHHSLMFPAGTADTITTTAAGTLLVPLDVRPDEPLRLLLSTVETRTVVPQVASSKKHPPEKKGGSGKTLKGGLHHKTKKRRDEVVSAETNDSKSPDDVSTLKMSPAGEMTVSKTSAENLSHRLAEPAMSEKTNVVPPAAFCKKSRPEGKGTRNKLDRHLHHKIKQQDDATPDDASTSTTLGAIFVGAFATRSGRSSTPQNTTGRVIRDSVTADPTTILQPEDQIVAFLAPDDDDQVEARIVKTVEERLRNQMKEGEIIVGTEVNDDDDSSTSCRLKKRTLMLLLLIIGGTVGGLVYWIVGGKDDIIQNSASEGVPVETTAAPTASDPLVEELRSLNAISDGEFSPFSDPESPQSQALAWMKNDSIVMSPGRSTQDMLQRYVLAVLFYSTSGPKWEWSQPYLLSSKDVCSWNNGTDVDVYGVRCRPDDDSVDQLVLFSNSLVGRLPWELVLLTNLESLDVNMNNVLGSLPSEFGRILSLTSLAVGDNKMTGTIPTEFGQLDSLEYLNIAHNQLNGTIPSELGQMLSLHYLYLVGNKITGTIPSELGQLLSLEDLYIADNQMTGTIPSELGQLLSSERWFIYDNQLTGTIPSELGRLLSMKAIHGGDNALTGPIPTELGRLLSFDTLEISNNLLAGTIPSELGQMISLYHVYIIGNLLTGTIPTELGQLYSLKGLGIQDNHLTGTIPSELAAIGNMTEFDFTLNTLTGSLDQSFCARNPNWDLLQFDCGEVECSCCAYCQ